MSGGHRGGYGGPPMDPNAFQGGPPAGLPPRTSSQPASPMHQTAGGGRGHPSIPPPPSYNTHHYQSPPVSPPPPPPYGQATSPINSPTSQRYGNVPRLPSYDEFSVHNSPQPSPLTSPRPHGQPPPFEAPHGGPRTFMPPKVSPTVSPRRQVATSPTREHALPTSPARGGSGSPGPPMAIGNSPTMGAAEPPFERVEPVVQTPSATPPPPGRVTESPQKDEEEAAATTVEAVEPAAAAAAPEANNVERGSRQQSEVHDAEAREASVMTVETSNDEGSRQGTMQAVPAPSRDLMASPGAEDMEEFDEMVSEQQEMHLRRSTTATYTFEQMQHIRSGCEEWASDTVLEYAANLWGKPRLGLEGSPPAAVQDIIDAIAEAAKEDFFGQHVKVLKPKRTLDLQNRVLGILNRVTPQKYDTVRDEMLRLPLQKADEEMLDKIVGHFFDKAVNEPNFSNIYAKLVVEICFVPQGQKQTGDQKLTLAHRFRKALLNRCQYEFETDKVRLGDKDKLDDDGNPLSAELLSIKETRMKKKLCGNVKFVGALYEKKLCTEKIIHHLVHMLSFGSQQQMDYEIEVLCTLIETTGRRFFNTPRGNTLFHPVMTQLDHLSKNYKTPRIRFLLMNTLELVSNDWKKKRADAGPMTHSELQRKMFQDAQQQHQDVRSPPPHEREPPMGHAGKGPVTILRRGAPSHVDPSPPSPKGMVTAPMPAGPSSGKASPSPQGASEPPAPRITVESVGLVMTRLVKSGDFEAAVTEMQKLGPVVDVYKVWFMRALTSARLTKERGQIVELVNTLVKKGCVGYDDCRAVLETWFDEMIEKEMYLETPKLWKCWGNLVSAGGKLFTHRDTLRFLARLLDETTEVPQIHQFIGDTTIGCDASVNVITPDNEYSRFRFLPVLLKAGNPITWVESVIEKFSTDTDVRVFQALRGEVDRATVFEEIRSSPQLESLAFLARVVSGVLCYAVASNTPIAKDSVDGLDFITLVADGTNRQERETIILAESFMTMRLLKRIGDMRALMDVYQGAAIVSAQSESLWRLHMKRTLTDLDEKDTKALEKPKTGGAGKWGPGAAKQKALT